MKSEPSVFVGPIQNEHKKTAISACSNTSFSQKVTFPHHKDFFGTRETQGIFLYELQATEFTYKHTHRGCGMNV